VKFARSALIVGAQTLVFGPLAAFRFLDGDEGVYAYASRLALHGHVPYRDFFYEQMPLLPYVYGAWIRIFGESWYAARSLSALAAAATGALLYLHVERRLGRWPALAAISLYALSGLVFGYFTIVKTFALASLFLFGAYVLVEARRPRWLAAGLLVGLAVDTRLVFAAAIPAFAVLAARRRGLLSPFGGGLAVGLVPSVVFLALSPHAFVFDNLRYHGEKTSHGLVGEPVQKLRTAGNLIGFGNTDHALGVQFLLLLVAAGAALWLLRRSLPFTAAVAVSLGIASFLPTPTYAQYFCIVVPYLVLLAVELAARWPRAVLAGLAAYAAAGAVALAHDVQTSPLLEPSIRSVERVAATVQVRTQPGETVLAGWPGYLFGTHTNAVSGYTNQFAPAAAAKVSPREARRVHVLSEPAIEALIRRRVPRLVVERNWVTSPPFADWDAALRQGRYRLVATVETARIYER
jgi:4-amino-4-deoxy-L-arabinose transferase-like glycosyltransferase